MQSATQTDEIGGFPHMIVNFNRFEIEKSLAHSTMASSSFFDPFLSMIRQTPPPSLISCNVSLEEGLSNSLCKRNFIFSKSRVGCCLAFSGALQSKNFSSPLTKNSLSERSMPCSRLFSIQAKLVIKHPFN